MKLAGIGGAILALCASPAVAGAWATPKDRTQVILKLESQRADEAFDVDAVRTPLFAERRDDVAELFVEHGLTDTLTLQVKGDWRSGQDAFVDFEGRGPIEIGVRWQAWRDQRTAVSIYAGYAWDGEGRNGGYVVPGMGDRDWEVRFLAGRSFGGGERRWLADGGFAEVQVARRFREGLADETRAEASLGIDVAANWQWLTQAFGGVSDNGSRWLNVETSAVRRMGDWSLQAGWRETVWGREAPAARGPVVAVWRRF